MPMVALQLEVPEMCFGLVSGPVACSLFSKFHADQSGYVQRQGADAVHGSITPIM